MTQPLTWTDRSLGPHLPSFNQLDQGRCLLERITRIAQGALGLVCCLGYSPKAFSCTKVGCFFDDLRMCMFACDLPITLLRFTEPSQGRPSKTKLLECLASFTVDVALFASFWEDQLPRIISYPGKLSAFPASDFLAIAIEPCLTFIYAADAVEKMHSWNEKPNGTTRLSFASSTADLASNILPMLLAEDLFNVITGTLGACSLWSTCSRV